MNYLKKLIKSIWPILIVTIIQYLIIIISLGIYILIGNKNTNIFVSNYASVILCIINIFIIYILLKKYQYKGRKINKKYIFPLISLGISISCFLNMIIFKIIPPTDKDLLPIHIAILSSGIIGPILEEILFRYILLNKLKDFNSNRNALIISTIIFAIVHINIVKVIYALILGIVLNIVYHKTNNLKASIIIHISANIMSIFLFKYNIYILLLSLINLIISTLILKKTLV